jgi:hypothetical protein
MCSNIKKGLWLNDLRENMRANRRISRIFCSQAPAGLGDQCQSVQSPMIEFAKQPAKICRVPLECSARYVAPKKTI